MFFFFLESGSGGQRRLGIGKIMESLLTSGFVDMLVRIVARRTRSFWLHSLSFGPLKTAVVADDAIVLQASALSSRHSSCANNLLEGDDVL